MLASRLRWYVLEPVEYDLCQEFQPPATHSDTVFTLRVGCAMIPTSRRPVTSDLALPHGMYAPLLQISVLWRRPPCLTLSPVALQVSRRWCVNSSLVDAASCSGCIDPTLIRQSDNHQPPFVPHTSRDLANMAILEVHASCTCNLHPLYQ